MKPTAILVNTAWGKIVRHGSTGGGSEGLTRRTFAKLCELEAKKTAVPIWDSGQHTPQNDNQLQKGDHTPFDGEAQNNVPNKF